ncbi:MAG TPA: 30S ribosomal protein S5 [Tepidisphaeraceae bacterium]|jgi:small subunit ribosomal protein S5|nr:30S ribosomal protein S5 [Tepidisphaeraceae bacterium]
MAENQQPEQQTSEQPAAPAAQPEAQSAPTSGMTGGGMGGGMGGGGGGGGGRGGRGGPQRGGGGGGQRGGGGGGGQRGGGQGGRGGPRRDRDRAADESGIESAVVRIYRCSKVVKGGRTFSFGALVVAGDRKGNIGIGYGKANEVPPAVEKATKDARKTMFKVNLKGTTVPHTVKGESGASTVILVPARPGTGVTAGKSVRPCMELAGITDILTKAYGSTSPKNLVKATIAALRQLQNREQVEQSRGVSLAKTAVELAGV